MVLNNESVSKILKLKNCTHFNQTQSESLWGVIRFKSDSIMQLEVILWFKFMNRKLLL